MNYSWFQRHRCCNPFTNLTLMSFYSTVTGFLAPLHLHLATDHYSYGDGRSSKRYLLFCTPLHIQSQMESNVFTQKFFDTSLTDFEVWHFRHSGFESLISNR
ncbi:hypothetical protein CW304_01490 [Bacillus sp. UFRGS-B20]|nr:hypothetical protein CW304_01490 [Bacillus sp. UFRGS-B20]